MQNAYRQPLREPTFIIIGAEKAGTTSLHHYLRHSKHVYMPKRKELRFFLDDELYNSLTYSGYLQRYFSEAGDQIALGEATPAYLRHPHKVAPRILNDISHGADMKFIVILRDPVERTISHYLHATRSATEARDFEAAIFTAKQEREVDPRSPYIRHSLYFDDCRSWLSYFGPGNFLFLQTESLSDPGTYSRVLRFLDVPDDEITFDLAKRKNPRARARSRTLMRILNQDGRLKRMVKRIVPVAFRRELREHLVRLNEAPGGETHDVSDETIECLRGFFRRDLQNLEKLLSLDLSGWK